MRRLLMLSALALSACPAPPDADGGTGGGSTTGGGIATVGGGVATGGGAATGGGGGTASGGGAATGGGSTTGGGAPTGGGGAGPMIALTDFCAMYPAAACAHLAQCNDYESASSAACLANETLEVNGLCDSARSGTLTYDPFVAAACLAELSATPLACYTVFPACGSLRSFNERARNVPWVFTTRSAQACASATCDAGTACDRDCTGPSCRPLRTVGQSCSSTRPFLPCDPATSWCGTLDAGAEFCLPLVPAGSDCSNNQCSPNSWCDFSAMPYRCRPLLDAGAACTPQDRCAEGICPSDGLCGIHPVGAACAGNLDCGTFDSPNICVGLTRAADGGIADGGTCAPRPSLGQACSYDWVVGFDPCHFELNQGCIDGTCQVLTPFSRDAGVECPIRSYGRIDSPFFGFAICQRGLTCLPSTTAHAPRTGRCAAPRQLGEPCNDPFWCAAGLACAQGSDGGNQCLTQPRAGEACLQRSCRNDSTCADPGDGGFVCTLRGGLDAGCASVVDCLSSLSCDVSGHCVNPIPGTSCTYDFECSGGACQNGQCVQMCLR